MTTEDIASYLGDNTELPDDSLLSLADEIYRRLDYSCIYEQIDLLVELLHPIETPSAPADAGE